MKLFMAVVVFVLLLVSPAIAEPIETMEDFVLDGAAAVIFASELNISNGSPYTRDFGERGMFGKLVTGETVARNIADYLDTVDVIFGEAKRLLVGPWNDGGYTEFSICELNGGKQLDLDTGKWVRSKGGAVIKIIHHTEYRGKTRNAFFLIDEGTLWRKGK